MDFDDFKKMDEDRKRERFDLFKEALGQGLKDQGFEGSADDYLDGVMGKAAKAAPNAKPRDATLSKTLAPVIVELRELTGDDTDTILRRAMGLLRSAVRHVKAGGTVQFVDAEGNAKTLKVRVKT